MDEVLTDVFHQDALIVLSDLTIDEVVKDAVGYDVSVKEDGKDLEIILQ